jgi:ERCC4-type nuclease
MECRYLVAPTEPPELRAIGITSLVPEQHGCDVLAISSTARIGFQRKTPSDFLSSLLDGRLQKQIAQIKCSELLTYSALLLEGQFLWTTDNQLLSPSIGTVFTRPSLQSLLIQVQIAGLLYLETDSISHTVTTIPAITKHLSKNSHDSLNRRPKTAAMSSWGLKTSRSWGAFLLQSFDTVGPATAYAIVDHFGSIPLTWTCTEEELTHVPGIGKTTAARLVRSLT